MSGLQICERLQDIPIATAIRESIWVFPILEGAHVLAICFFVGMILLMDLRLLGLGLNQARVSEVANRVLPLAWGGYGVAAMSGGLVLCSEAVRVYGSTAFRIKFCLMALAGINALVFHKTIYRSVSAWDAQVVPPLQARLAGGSSLLLWVGIVVAGRAVGYRF